MYTQSGSSSLPFLLSHNIIGLTLNHSSPPYPLTTPPSPYPYISLTLTTSPIPISPSSPPTLHPPSLSLHLPPPYLPSNYLPPPYPPFASLLPTLPLPLPLSPSHPHPNLQEEESQLIELQRQSLVENLIGMGFPIDWALRAVVRTHSTDILKPL